MTGLKAKIDRSYASFVYEKICVVHQYKECLGCKYIYNIFLYTNLLSLLKWKRPIHSICVHLVCEEEEASNM